MNAEIHLPNLFIYFSKHLLAWNQPFLSRFDFLPSPFNFFSLKLINLKLCRQVSAMKKFIKHKTASAYLGNTTLIQAVLPKQEKKR